MTKKIEILSKNKNNNSKRKFKITYCKVFLTYYFRENLQLMLFIQLNLI
jgi:hypothetical protein